jgi:hypothetical protein
MFPVALSTRPVLLTQSISDKRLGRYDKTPLLGRVSGSDEVVPGIDLDRAEGDDVEFWRGDCFVLCVDGFEALELAGCASRSSSSIDLID